MKTNSFLLSILAVLFLATSALAADQRIQATEKMIGANHPTLSDTLNRLSLIEHNNDGTHKKLTQVKDPYIDVRAYGAVCDGTTNDTTAIQSAITATVGNKTKLIFPKATCKITAALTIPTGNHWEIDLGEATITQATDNTPIFKFNSTAGTDQWNFFKFGNGKLTWSNTQPVANTSAVAIAFTTSINNNLGIYHAEFHNLHITNGYRGLATTHATYSFTVWGSTFRNIRTSTMSGSTVFVNFSNAAGMPNNRFESIYILASSTNAAEVLINLSQMNSLVLDNIEVNTINDNKALLLTACISVKVGTIRVEGGTRSTAYVALIESSYSVGMVVDTIEIQSVTFSGIYSYVVRESSSGAKLSKMVIRTIAVRNCTVSGTELTLMQSPSKEIVLDDFYLSGNTGTIRPVYAYDTSVYNCKVNSLDIGPMNVLDAGDAAVTVYFKDATNGTSPAIILYNTPITANRAVAEPTGALRYPGMKYRVVRTAAATGAFNVQVFTGPVKNLAAGEWCEVTLFQTAAGTYTWRVTAFGAL